MGGIAVGPFDRSRMFVVEADVAHDSLGRIGFGVKDPARDEITLDL